jgi:hypothetical protein
MLELRDALGAKARHNLGAVILHAQMRLPTHGAIVRLHTAPLTNQVLR